MDLFAFLSNILHTAFFAIFMACHPISYWLMEAKLNRAQWYKKEYAACSSNVIDPLSKNEKATTYIDESEEG